MKLMKFLMDLFLFVMFSMACSCYALCYQHATDHSFADKIGTGFIAIMTVFAFVMMSCCAVHDD